MDINGNYYINVWSTSRGSTRKRLTHTTFKHPWIFPSQVNTRIVDTCVENHFVYIGSGKFWCWICWMVACRLCDNYIKMYGGELLTDWEVKL